MHAAVKQAREDEALRTLARDVGGFEPRLAKLEGQMAEVLRQGAEALGLLRGLQPPHVAPAPQSNARGGR